MKNPGKRRRPTPQMFGFTPESFAAEKEKQDKRQKIQQSSFSSIVFLVCLFALPLVYSQTDYDESTNMAAYLVMWVGGSFLLCFLAIFYQRMKARKVVPANPDYDAYTEAYQTWYKQQRDYWKNMNERVLVDQFARLLRRMGYEALVTPPESEDAFDIQAMKDDEGIAIKCRSEKKPLGPKDIMKLYEAYIGDPEYSHAMMVNPRGFNKWSRNYAKSKSIELVSLPRIMSMVIEAPDEDSPGAATRNE